MTGLFFALVGLVYEKAHSREIFKMGGFATMMPGIADGVHDRRPVVARAAGDRRLRRRVPDVPRRLAVGAPVVAVPRRDRRVPHVDLRAAGRPSRSSGARRAPIRTSRTCLTRRAPSGWRSCILVFVIVLFGVAAGAGARRRLTRRPCRCSRAWGCCDERGSSRRWRGRWRSRSGLVGLIAGSCCVIGLLRRGPVRAASAGRGRSSGSLVPARRVVVHDARGGRRSSAAPSSLDELALFAKRLFLVVGGTERAGRARPAGAGRFAPARRRVPRRAAGVAARHAGARLGARADAALRRVRADVDSALLPDRLPEARRAGAGRRAEVLPGRHASRPRCMLYGLSFVYGVDGHAPTMSRHPPRARGRQLRWRCWGSA